PLLLFSRPPSPPRPPLFPYTTLFRSWLHPNAAALRDLGREAAARGRVRARRRPGADRRRRRPRLPRGRVVLGEGPPARDGRAPRSEEHTSELQSRENLVCRLLLEKKK